MSPKQRAEAFAYRQELPSFFYGSMVRSMMVAAYLAGYRSAARARRKNVTTVTK